MMLALRTVDAHLRDQPQSTWNHLRVEAAEDHASAPPGSFVCPLNGCPVSSRFVNNIWQWIHDGRCHLKPRSRKRLHS